MSGEPSNAVFISYRREEGGLLAMALYQRLTEHGVDAFYDIESIRAGQFDTIILNQIAARPYFLLVLTPGTLERADDPGDWLRREIEQALTTQRVIVPVHTPNFNFGDVERFLPGDLGQQVGMFNAQELPLKWFEVAVQQLVDEFLVPIQLENLVPPAAEQAAVDRLHQEARAAPAVTEVQLSAQEYLERAVARAEDDLDGKIADYSEALRLNAQHPQAFYCRGLARRDKGDLEGAIDDYSEALRLNPQHAQAFYNRALARRDRGDLEGAIDDLEEGARFAPTDEDFPHLLAELRSRGIPGPEPPPPPPPPPAPPPHGKLRGLLSRRRILIAGGVAVVALLSAAVAIIVVRDGPTTTLPFKDDFSSDEYGWPNEAEGQVGGRYANDAYLILAQASDRAGAIASPRNAPTAENVHIDVEAEVTDESAAALGSGYAYGIVCRASEDFKDLYRFTVWPAGPAVHIQKLIDGVPQKPRLADEQLPGVDKELQASCVTNAEGEVELEIVVNGVPIRGIDKEPLETGAYGLLALLSPAHEPEATLQVQFDNFVASETEAQRR